MKPTYKELVEKLQELTNILGDQNQDDNYDEIIGHVVTEAQDLLDRAKESQPVLVITVRDGVVNEAKLFDNVHRAEECFTLECLDKGASKDDIEAHIEDGYYQGMNFAVCLVHPEILTEEIINGAPDPDRDQ